MNNKSRGVYFLANDEVIDLAIAFLNSFRTYNPEIPLCLIPYNDDSRELLKLEDKYKFSTFSNIQTLHYCDKVSKQFHPYLCGAYRKLAMWEGDFEEFVYIDLDTIVMAGVDFIFKHLSDYDFILSYSNIPEIVKRVWKKSIYTSGGLTEDQIAFGANTGFIASNKDALTLEAIKGKVEDALKLSGHMELECKEQSFLNYLIVTSEKKYTSIFVLAFTKHITDLRHEWWAGNDGGVVKDGQLTLQGKHKIPLLFVHWAGRWQPNLLEGIIFRILSILRIKKRSDKPTVSFFMPYKSLWQYYRYMGI